MAIGLRTVFQEQFQADVVPEPDSSKATASLLAHTERVLAERILMKLYPRLECFQLPFWKWFHGPMIPGFLTPESMSDLRRVVEIGCGDGAFSNLMALLFPNLEVIGIDEVPHAIGDAKATLGQRTNLKFLKAKAMVLSEIPCDRIHYNHCLVKSQGVYGFQKLLFKTSQWTVDEGHIVVQESPLAWLGHPALLKTILPYLKRTGSLTEALKLILQEVGFETKSVYYSRGALGLPSQIFLQATRQPAWTGFSLLDFEPPEPVSSARARRETSIKKMPVPVLDSHAAKARYSDLPEHSATLGQSNENLLQFLFSETELDLGRVLAKR